MSLLTLQYGQCGNQIGEILYSTVFEDIRNDSSSYLRDSLNKWFNIQSNGKWEARSILIDTETKVVNARKRTPYEFKNIVFGPNGGSANNWAFGYNRQVKALIEPTLDMVRLEMEKTDCSVTLLNILSSSGGTGSGVGSKIIEELRNMIPNKAIVNAIVLPYMNGEIVTQSYNTLLSLAKLHVISDSLILFRNDELHDLCSMNMNENLNFADLNKLIAFQLVSTFQPITDVNNTLILTKLTAHPLFKYLHLKSSFSCSEYFKLESSQSWKNIIDSLMKKSKWDSKNLNSLTFKRKSIISTIISRGRETPEYTEVDIMRPKNFVNWMPPTECFIHHHENRGLCGKSKTITMISNDNSICYFLHSMLEDAWTLFSKKAYLHHYLNFNVGEDEFQESFQVMENILAGYKRL